MLCTKTNLDITRCNAERFLRVFGVKWSNLHSRSMISVFSKPNAVLFKNQDVNIQADGLAWGDIIVALFWHLHAFIFRWTVGTVKQRPRKLVFAAKTAGADDVRFYFYLLRYELPWAGLWKNRVAFASSTYCFARSPAEDISYELSERGCPLLHPRFHSRSSRWAELTAVMLFCQVISSVFCQPDA